MRYCYNDCRNQCVKARFEECCCEQQTCNNCCQENTVENCCEQIVTTSCCCNQDNE